MAKKWSLKYYWWFTHRDNTQRVEIPLKADDEESAKAEAVAQWKERSKNMPKPDSLGYFYEDPQFLTSEPLVLQPEPA